MDVIIYHFFKKIKLFFNLLQFTTLTRVQSTFLPRFFRGRPLLLLPLSPGKNAAAVVLPVKSILR